MLFYRMLCALEPRHIARAPFTRINWRNRCCLGLSASAAALALLLAGGCTLTPPGTKDEQKRLADVGKSYEQPFEQRDIPDLPPDPTWKDILQRAFLTNGDIEAAYFRWKSAVERIGIAGAYPNSDVSLGYSYMFSSERMNSFDRSTFTAGFDSSMNLSLPVKVQQAAKVALDEARVEGEKFRVAKFDLQRTVLKSWADYILQDRVISLRSEDVALRRAMVQAASAGARAGGRVRETIAADLELRTAESELLDLRVQHDSSRASLNVLIGRTPKAPLAAPATLPPLRKLPADDVVMLRAASEVFPEIAAMAREVEGRADAIELARLRWLPDINPTLGFTGSVSQAVGAMITLPTTIARIKGQVREAESDLRASQAQLRQRTSDRVGEFVSLLLMYRNAQRHAELFERVLLPAAERLSADQSRAYEVARGWARRAPPRLVSRRRSRRHPRHRTPQ